MKAKNKINKPWLDHRGRELPTASLQEISKGWDLKTWNSYADSLESPAEGKSLKPRKFRKIQEGQTKSIFSSPQRALENARILQITQALDQLSSKEKLVIEHIFYQGKSLEEAACAMGISKPTAFERKNIALAKLKGVLSVRPNAVATYEGSSNWNEDSKTPFEELLEVMNEDISREEPSRNNFDKGDVK